MKFKLFLLFLFVITSRKFCYCQCNYRIKEVSVNGKNIDFLLPPKAKIAKEGFIFHKKKLVFETTSRFRYQYIIIKGITKEYTSSIEAVAKASYKRLKSKISTKELAKYNINTGPLAINSSLGTAYYVSPKNDNLILEIDYDLLLNNLSQFKIYYLDLFTKLSELNENNTWAGANGSIVRNIMQAFFELTPIPQDQSLGRYMAILNDNIAFLLLDPKIWLQVDNAQKEKPKLSYVDNHNNIIKGDDDFWSYNLKGVTVIKFFYNNDGSLMQYPLLKFSTNTTFPANTLNIDAGAKAQPYEGTLQASTADIQLTQNLNKQKYMYLFQHNFKRNNSNATPIKNFDANNFSEDNSQLLFNSLIDNSFINSIDVAYNPQSDNRTKYSVFGMRNLINAVVPIRLNNETSTVNLNSTLSINKNQGLIPPIEKIKVYRIYKGSYKPIKSFKDDLLILPDDKIEF
jgi:hypothetical protein